MEKYDATVTEQPLWQLLREGGRQAFEVIFSRYHATLYHYGYKLTAHPALVQKSRLSHKPAGNQRAVFPLPQIAINSNPKLVQNPDYQ